MKLTLQLQLLPDQPTGDRRLSWALSELARWIQPDDDHPACLDAYVGAEASRSV